MITFPRIVVPFLCEKRNNRPRLLFEEVRYVQRRISAVLQVLAYAYFFRLLPSMRGLVPRLHKFFPCWIKKTQNVGQSLPSPNKKITNDNNEKIKTWRRKCSGLGVRESLRNHNGRRAIDLGPVATLARLLTRRSPYGLLSRDISQNIQFGSFRH